MLGILKGGMHASFPPNALLFRSPSIAREKVLPVCLVNTASNLQVTSEHRIGYQNQPQHLMQEAGTRVHASCIPLPADYAPLILTRKTLLMVDDIDDMNLITVISSRHLPYLCTQEGVSPRIPSDSVMSPGPHGIYLHSLTLISQSVLSI